MWVSSSTVFVLFLIQLNNFSYFERLKRRILSRNSTSLGANCYSCVQVLSVCREQRVFCLPTTVYHTTFKWHISGRGRGGMRKPSFRCKTFFPFGRHQLQRVPLCSREIRIKASPSTCFLLCPKTEDIKELQNSVHSTCQQYSWFTFTGYEMWRRQTDSRWQQCNAFDSWIERRFTFVSKSSTRQVLSGVNSKGTKTHPKLLIWLLVVSLVFRI